MLLCKATTASLHAGKCVKTLILACLRYCVAIVPMVDHFVSACKRGVEYNILLLLVNHVCR